MRTGSFNVLSSRDYEGIRERRAFERAEAEKQREAEDRQEYEKYVAALNGGIRAPGFQVQPLSFEEWRSLAPESETDPSTRGTIATHSSLQQQLWRGSRRVVAEGTLAENELVSLGFDLTLRPDEDRLYVSGQEANLDSTALKEDVKEAVSEFLRSRPTFDREKSLGPLLDFLERNCLYPTAVNLEQATLLLETMSVITPKAPVQTKPEPFVNLAIDRSKEYEHTRYLTEIVVTDPRDGKGYTQYQVDREMDSDTYRRLFLGEFRTPVIGDVIKSAVK